MLTPVRLQEDDLMNIQSGCLEYGLEDRESYPVSVTLSSMVKTNYQDIDLIIPKSGFNFILELEEGEITFEVATV